MAIRVTQTGLEVWLRNHSNIRVTQIGLEVWRRGTGVLRVTQIGLEVWRSTASAPTTNVGRADGYSTCYAINAQAYLIQGNADGYATAQNYTGLRGRYMIDMGI